MGRSTGMIIAAVVAVIVIISMSVFTVNETELALRFRLGEIVDSKYEPGLHFKVPLINNIRKFDKRIQTLDAEPERFLTVEKKNVIVDSFVMWRVSEVARYYTAVAGDVRQANVRLDQIIKDEMRSEVSKRTLQEAVSGERAQIMDVLTTAANTEARQLGIKVVDVRIKRMDLPPEVSNSVYSRMRAERERVARDFRSRGQEAAERIMADADRQSAVLLAEAYRDSEILRGEGDAKSASIYALAFNKDQDFFRFYRSLNAYRNSFTGQRDILLLEPDSDFFRFFRKSNPIQDSP